MNTDKTKQEEEKWSALHNIHGIIDMPSIYPEHEPVFPDMYGNLFGIPWRVVRKMIETELLDYPGEVIARTKQHKTLPKGVKSVLMTKFTKWRAEHGYVAGVTRLMCFEYHGYAPLPYDADLNEYSGAKLGELVEKTASDWYVMVETKPYQFITHDEARDRLEDYFCDHPERPVLTADGDLNITLGLKEGKLVFMDETAVNMHFAKNPTWLFFGMAKSMSTRGRVRTVDIVSWMEEWMRTHSREKELFSSETGKVSTEMLYWTASKLGIEDKYALSQFRDALMHWYWKCGGMEVLEHAMDEQEVPRTPSPQQRRTPSPPRLAKRARPSSVTRAIAAAARALTFSEDEDEEDEEEDE